MGRAGLDSGSVLQAAAALADREGYEGVTLAALAAELGVKTPSLYNHISGLPGLRKELAVYGLVQLRHRLAEAVAGKAGSRAVHATGLAYVEFARRHPGLYEGIMRAPDVMDAEVEAAGDALLHLLLQVLDAYGLEREDALHTVRGLRSLLHGFAALEMRGGFGMSLDNNKSLDLLLRTYLAGLEQSVQAAEAGP
ncbi:TetR/AcrR family transcriptional regulator [Paenibacillus mucilaginosus]|uniref:Transcriptional regulator, TetR family n=1 Tax=Paenibacillus mucilaginosus (strain KNP414) TaxID=1036673 RepID=F8FNC0_PAEMK|nr:TetR/AcrR family transcriptional regulator [Paenibacillus mucilaginosus]AEI38957.1 transcriptional regulator, TetR family [Paenibacillus mucilaginosus KNP414]MCG7216578.1 TetR/AcrR family transcriptional regulator [Paenibacillus mucilaginosus]WDM28002.1 TetR/AcrR family transcriptional regulator [Paenibacillus mucilaginosus]